MEGSSKIQLIEYLSNRNDWVEDLQRRKRKELKKRVSENVKDIKPDGRNVIHQTRNTCPVI